MAVGGGKSKTPNFGTVHQKTVQFKPVRAYRLSTSTWMKAKYLEEVNVYRSLISWLGWGALSGKKITGGGGCSVPRLQASDGVITSVEKRSL